MTIKLFLLFFGVTFLEIVIGQSEYDIVRTPCSTNGTLLNYNIYSDNIAQFFSPKYPQNLIVNESITSCQARFYTIIKDHRIWMALYNGYTESYTAFDDNNNQFGDSYFDSNAAVASFSSKTQSLTFELDTFEASSDWAAFQGVVIAYDPATVHCPFSGQSIGFTNVENTLIIPIASDFGSKRSNIKCFWNFNTYFGQYLKIVFKQLVVNSNVHFELQQSGKRIKRFDKNISDTEVYYFTSDAGSFTLYYNDTNDASVGTYFSALISDVNVPSSSTTETCPFSMDSENNTNVYNLDYENGYQANQNCEYSIITQENQEIQVRVSIFHIEKNIDTLFLIHNSNKYPLNTDGMYKLQLTTAANNSLITFNADSSVQQAGFEVTLKTVECTCSTQEILIPCEYEIQVDSISYCDGINCSYHISKNTTCSDNGYQLFLMPIIRENLDAFYIYVNGTLRETLNEATNYKRFFTSDTEITVEFISGISPQPIKTSNNFWSMTLMSQDLPTVTPSMLTETFPTFAVELSTFDQNNIISVCSPQNDTLELFVASYKTLLQHYILYDGSDFENFLGKLDSPQIFKNNSNFGQITSKSNCFTIQNTGEASQTESGMLLFRMKNAQSKNCQNQNNVMPFSNEYANFANTAKNTGDCEMIILSPADFPFPFFINSMNGTSENIFTFKSTLNQNILAEINSTDFSSWVRLQIYIPALTIILPASTSFNMTAIYGDGNIYVYSDIQKGIMASPSYSAPGCNFGTSGVWQQLYTIETSDSLTYISAEFILQSIEGNESLRISSDFYSDDYNLTTPGEKLVLNGTQFQLFNMEMNSMNDSFLIEYVLYSIPFRMSTTASASTTSIYTTYYPPPPFNFSFPNPSTTSTTTTTTTPPAPITHIINNGICNSFSLMVILIVTGFFKFCFEMFN